MKFALGKTSKILIFFRFFGSYISTKSLLKSESSEKVQETEIRGGTSISGRHFDFIFVTLLCPWELYCPLLLFMARIKEDSERVNLSLGKRSKQKASGVVEVENEWAQSRQKRWQMIGHQLLLSPCSSDSYE